jgi:hypothetical protein
MGSFKVASADAYLNIGRNCPAQVRFAQARFDDFSHAAERARGARRQTPRCMVSDRSALRSQYSHPAYHNGR